MRTQAINTMFSYLRQGLPKTLIQTANIPQDKNKREEQITKMLEKRKKDSFILANEFEIRERNTVYILCSPGLEDNVAAAAQKVGLNGYYEYGSNSGSLVLSERKVVDRSI